MLSTLIPLHMKRWLRISAAALLLGWTGSCNKDKTNELDGDWLFPIAKGTISINSFSELENLNYQIDVPAISLGLPENVQLSSPGLQIAHVGPFPVRITDWLHRLDIDTLRFSGSLNNFFPIPIGEGTMISMRNSRDTSAASIVGSARIGADVPPGASFSFNIEVNNKTIGDSVFFYLDQFNSPPYSQVVFAPTPAKLNITLNVVTAKYVEIYTNKTFSSIDTSEFSAGDDDPTNNSPLSDTAASGVINVFTDNGLPANVRGQLLFLNESKTAILDSMFINGLDIAGGQTDATGTTTVTNSKKSVVPVLQKKLNNIKLAKYVVSHFELNTFGYSGLFVSANKGPKLTIQFTGDLNIRINF